MRETILDKKTLGLGSRVQILHRSAQDLGQDLMSMINLGLPLFVSLVERETDHSIQPLRRYQKNIAVEQ